MTRHATPFAGSTAFEASSDDGSSFTWVRRVASSPVVHFALLGALVFAGHRWVTPPPEPPTIKVSASKQRELTKWFEQRMSRGPDEAEREELVQRYVEGEVLFREGARLRLAETDPALREQIIARVRSLLQAEQLSSPPSERELQGYYDEHRSDYAIPETVSYREYWIQRGPQAGAAARQLMQALRGEGVGERVPAASDHPARSRAQLVSLYDEQVASALWALPDGTYHELRSERGIHIVRVEGHAAAVQLSFSDVREQVSDALLKDRAQRAFQAELDRLISQWRVSVAEAP